MKKLSEKKLHRTKLKIANLSQQKQRSLKGGAATADCTAPGVKTCTSDIIICTYNGTCP